MVACLYVPCDRLVTSPGCSLSVAQNQLRIPATLFGKSGTENAWMDIVAVIFKSSNFLLPLVAHSVKNKAPIYLRIQIELTVKPKDK